MLHSFTLTETFTVSPETLYNAWLDSNTHSQMTGGDAMCSTEINGYFSTWDGYVTGYNINLIPYREIIQAWRTTEFSVSDEDSKLIIKISESGEGSLLTLTHQNIPTGQSDYEKGWVEHYFEPMKAYFK